MDTFHRNKYKFSTTPNLVEISNNANEIRKEQILKLEEELFTYGVLIKDLFAYVPSKNERNLILNIAFFIIGQVELLEYVQNNKKVPINILSRKVKRPRKKLIEWSDYLTFYIIIFSNPSYNLIQDYLNVEEIKEEEKKDNILVLKNERHNEGKKIVIEKLIIERKDSDKEKIGNNNDAKEEVIELKRDEDTEESLSNDSNRERGIVLKIFKKSACILTSLGEVKKINIEGEITIGEEVNARVKKRMKDFKLLINVSLIALAVGLGFFTYKYNTVDRILLINTTSKVKLELNCFNNVINAYSPTDKGEEMVKTLKLDNLNVDDSLRDVLRYSSENEMIPDNGILVTVTGKPIKYGTLKDTSEYVTKNNINLTINNGGNERNLYYKQAEK